MTNIKVLVVEDEAIVAEDIADRLGNMGYCVVNIVATGEEAIREATYLCRNTTAPLDLVLMDIMLKGEVDGIEAAQYIHTELNVPVVYLTANADETTLQRVKVTQPFGYILKPFKEKELKAAIEIALSRHRVELEVKEALALAKKLQQEAQQLNTLKSQFIAMVSHEFRAPLTVIRVTAEHLQCHAAEMPEDKKQQNFQQIQAATDSMNQLLEDVLTLGQTENDAQSFNFLPLEMVSFCRELLESPQWEITTLCTVEFTTHCDRLQACVDGRLLWHLLNNLLTNAVKYSPQGGIVALILSVTELEICLQVQDQGIGIPLEDQKNLFEPFQRARNVGKIPGTGLGLAIARRAAEIHGGRIAIDSEVGRGTTFTVMLPLRLSL